MQVRQVEAEVHHLRRMLGVCDSDGKEQLDRYHGRQQLVSSEESQGSVSCHNLQQFVISHDGQQLSSEEGQQSVSQSVSSEDGQHVESLRVCLPIIYYELIQTCQSYHNACTIQ